jgi:very-short-patch-repair endonuclease
MMEKQNNKMHRDLARNLRKNMTTAEQQLWGALRKRQLDGYRFRRQTVLGRYIADFVCLEARLVIELDGNHHVERQGYDRERDNWMHQQQFQVLRFWNHEILNHRESILQQIRHALLQQPKNTS